MSDPANPAKSYGTIVEDRKTAALAGRIAHLEAENADLRSKLKAAEGRIERMRPSTHVVGWLASLTEGERQKTSLRQIKEAAQEARVALSKPINTEAGYVYRCSRCDYEHTLLFQTPSVTLLCPECKTDSVAVMDLIRQQDEET